jgi:hypothetical protein
VGRRGAWQPRSNGALPGGPGAASDSWDPLISVFRIKISPRMKIAQNK